MAQKIRWYNTYERKRVNAGRARGKKKALCRASRCRKGGGSATHGGGLSIKFLFKIQGEIFCKKADKKFNFGIETGGKI